MDYIDVRLNNPQFRGVFPKAFKFFLFLFFSLLREEEKGSVLLAMILSIS